MRVLFLSKEGDGLGVAHKLTQQDNEVFFWIKEERFKLAGQGIVKRISNWREGLRKCDLVICDMVGFGMLEETLRGLGKPSISCSLVLEQAELQRGLGMQLFNTLGVLIPETLQCRNAAEAKKVALENWGEGWVVKPDGNQSTAKTRVVKEKELWDYSLHDVSGSLIIQRIIDGVEVSTEGWFNGRDFIRPFNHTFEEKKFLNDNLGPATGCMGNVVLAASSNKLTRQTIEKLKPFLSTISYRGPVDINCIVNESGAYALEITARMGYDAVEALLEGLRQPVIDLFFETANGSMKEMQLTSETMMAVRLSIPPWPSAKPKEIDHGEPVLGLDPAVLKHFAATDLYKEGGKFYTAGGDGVLGKATATGRADGGDITREASRRVYRTLENIKVDGKQYRTDVGSRVNKDWAKLKSWGWV